MSNLTWQIGDVRITRVTELETPTSPRLLFDDEFGRALATVNDDPPSRSCHLPTSSSWKTFSQQASWLKLSSS